MPGLWLERVWGWESVTAKYSTGDSEATTWTEDRRLVLQRWRTKPFDSHRHRHETVEHRLVVEYTHGVGADVVHEARSEDSSKFADDWEPVETVEVRDGFARHDRRVNARWLK